MGTDAVHLGLFWSKAQPDKGVEGLRLLTSSEVAEIGEAARVLSRFANRPMFALQSELYRSAREAIAMLAIFGLVLLAILSDLPSDPQHRHRPDA